ncbi:hypothetical protein [Aeromicrobium halocynthiae]|uniref:hypothetical protein n=1 Tax=Aeromicrobium halocynthiae TaxID=560557 RepID=UPI0031DA4560
MALDRAVALLRRHADAQIGAGDTEAGGPGLPILLVEGVDLGVEDRDRDRPGPDDAAGEGRGGPQARSLEEQAGRDASA